jgi:glutathione S-transferase
MAQPEAKRLKTDDAPYELIYWPVLPGRGEVIRLLFVESGTSYTDTSAAPPQEAAGAVMGWTAADNTGDATNPPIFACPILKHGDLTLSQLPNILLYLSPKLGLGPADGPAFYHLNSIALTLLDGFVNEVHETHHPIDITAYYDDQKVEAKKRAKAYVDVRLPRFLGYVQRLLDAKTSGDGPWLYGGELTYVDLVAFQVSPWQTISPEGSGFLLEY